MRLRGVSILALCVGMATMSSVARAEGPEFNFNSLFKILEHEIKELEHEIKEDLEKHRHGLDAYKHIVVIYQENHSFDNLYGQWGRVGNDDTIGLDDADRAHTIQVKQDNTTSKK